MVLPGSKQPISAHRAESGAHTPAPWTIIDGHQNRGIYGPDGDCVAEVHWWIMEHAEEAKANARLIAASPTMHQYIAQRAAAGDGEALDIMEAINASR